MVMRYAAVRAMQLAREAGVSTSEGFALATADDRLDVAAEALARILELAGELDAGGLVLAFDPPVPSWRAARFPDYKGHRSTDTGPWIETARSAYRAIRLACLTAFRRVGDGTEGYEADDVIATLAHRVAGTGRKVAILSNDSDLLQLAAPTVECWQIAQHPVRFRWVSPAAVCAKYGIGRPDQLADYKALVGEPGDNLPGVRGIGPKRAAAYLADHERVARMKDVFVERARGGEDGAAAWADACRIRGLCALRTDVPLPPIPPDRCRTPADPARTLRRLRALRTATRDRQAAAGVRLDDTASEKMTRRTGRAA